MFTAKLLLEMIFLGAADLTSAESGILYLKEDDSLKIKVVRSSVLNVALGGHGSAQVSDVTT